MTMAMPLVLFPLLKIMPGNEVAAVYGHHFVFLFLGGFLIALAIEESGLHRRVALTIVSAMGDNPRRVVAGFMLAAIAVGLIAWKQKAEEEVVRRIEQLGGYVEKNDLGLVVLLSLRNTGSYVEGLAQNQKD